MRTFIHRAAISLAIRAARKLGNWAMRRYDRDKDDEWRRVALLFYGAEGQLRIVQAREML